MCPVPSVHNVSHGLPCYAKLIAERCVSTAMLSSNINPSHFGNLRCRQFRATSIFSARVIAATLLFLVVNIICLCAEEQMVWSDTCSNVTTMQNELSIWNRAVGYNPREAVGFYLSESSIFPMDEKGSITLRVLCAVPKPASAVCFGNFWPKSCLVLGGGNHGLVFN